MRRNSSVGRGSQFGWWFTPSNSRYGMPRMAASSLASVDLPEPEVPTTDTRRTIAERNTARRGTATLSRREVCGIRGQDRNSLSTGDGQIGQIIHKGADRSYPAGVASGTVRVHARGECRWDYCEAGLL